MFFIGTEPVTTINSLGPAVGAAVICTGLFITAQIQLGLMRRTIEQHTKDDSQNFEKVNKDNSELKGLVATAVASITDVARSLQHVAEGLKEQAQVHAEQLAELRENSKDITKIVENQVILTANFQRLMEQLIGMLKG